MKPETPITPPPNLDFILQSNQKKQNGLLAGGSKSRRIAVVAIAGILLVVAIFAFVTVLQNRNRRGLSELVDLAAYQTELIRLTEIAAKDSVASVVRGSAQTSRLTLISDLNKTKLMIASLGTKNVEADLSKYRTESIDKTLKEAKTANNFDDTYTTLFSEKLTNYEERLATAYLAQSNIKIKNTISIFNTHSETIGFNESTVQ